MYRSVTLGILVVALVLRLMGLSKGIWVDEWSSIQVSLSGGLIHTLDTVRDGNHPPLYFVLLNIWSRISTSEPFLRGLSVVLGIATIFVAMAWLNRNSGMAGLLMGIFLGGAPILLRYSQEIRNYSLLLFVAVLAFYFSSQIIDRPERLYGYVGMGLSLTLALMTHLIGVFLILPAWIFLFMMLGGKGTVQWQRVASASAIPVALFLFEYLFYLKDVNKPGTWWVPPVSIWMISSTGRELSGLSVFPWPWDITRHLVIILLPLFALALVFGDWRRSAPFLAAAVAYWVQVVGYSFFGTPILMDKVVLPGFIPFLGFLALQIATIRLKRVRALTISACVLITVAFGLSWAVQKAWQPVEPWKEMSRVLESQWQPNSLLIFYPDYCEGPVRYYFTSLRDEVALDVAPSMTREQLADSLAHRWSSLGQRDSTSTAFLVVRYDAHVSRDSTLLPALLADLKRTARGALAVNMLAFSSEQSSAGLRAALASVLGTPKHISDFGRFVLEEYRSESTTSTAGF